MSYLYLYLFVHVLCIMKSHSDSDSWSLAAGSHMIRPRLFLWLINAAHIANEHSESAGLRRGDAAPDPQSISRVW